MNAVRPLGTSDEVRDLALPAIADLTKLLNQLVQQSPELNLSFLVRSQSGPPQAGNGQSQPAHMELGQSERARFGQAMSKAMHLAPADDDILLERVSAEVRRRKLRSDLLGVPQDMFSMPAWEILLELFLAELTGQKTNVSTVGLCSGIAPSTAQRWLVLLEKRNLVERRPDFADKRRQWIRLSRRTHKALRIYFSA